MMRLNDSRAKLRRAQEHFDALKGQIEVFLARDPYRIVIDRPTNGIYIARLDNAPDIPAEDWGLLAGDCVHNLRVALDYLAWRLAGSDLGDTETQFPIFSTVQGWNKRPGRLKRMSVDARDVLRKLQPFNSAEPTLNALHGIRVLDDANKHKLLTVVAAVPHQLSLIWSSDDSSEAPHIELVTEPILSGNAILATVAASYDVQMQTEFIPEIVFGKGLFTDRILVLATLQAGLGATTSIIEFFENRPQFFPS